MAIQKHKELLPRGFLAEDGGLVRVQFQIGQLKRHGGPSPFQRHQAGIKTQLGEVNWIGPGNPARLHRLDLLNHRDESVDHAIDPAHDAQLNFGLHKHPLDWNLRLIAFPARALQTPMTLDALHGAIGAAELTLACEVAAAMHKLRQLADADSYLPGYHLPVFYQLGPGVHTWRS